MKGVGYAHEVAHMRVRSWQVLELAMKLAAMSSAPAVPIKELKETSLAAASEASCCPPPDLGEPMLAGEAMSGERMLHGVDGASPSPRSPGRRNAAGGEPSSLIDGPGACA